MNKLSYLSFATDEALYLADAYSRGMRYNAMVSQAQRACELYLKHLIDKSLMNNTEVMMSHNLRSLYEEAVKLGYDLGGIRSDVMTLNNFYTHTRYPGRDAFMATNEDITAALEALQRISLFLGRLF